jgi:tRNA (guanine37-N1)-methyltransferase
VTGGPTAGDQTTDDRVEPKMRFDIVTIFPAMVEQVLGAGIVGRAIGRGTLKVTVHDLRDFTTDRHRVVDDVPYGGGPGMVLKPEPLLRALAAIELKSGAKPLVLLTSPQGTRLTQEVVQRLSRSPHLVLLCGRYEGIDERVRSRVDEEISIGDYVLSGGEVPALVIVDAIARLVPGVVGDQQSVVDDSFSRGLLDYPQYTRPAEISAAMGLAPESGDSGSEDGPADKPGDESSGRLGETRGGLAATATETSTAPAGAAGTLRVPDVLLSGNHAEIRRWRKREAVSRTLARRPDLLNAAALDDEELAMLRELKEQAHERD